MRDPAPPTIFDRALYARRRARAAATIDMADFLHRRAMADIVDRLETVTREFPLALFYGADRFTNMVTPECGVGAIIHADLVRERVGGRPGVAFDEEASPIAHGSLDLIVSLLTLHAANDPVGALAQMRAALKPDGLLVVALFGEETLDELRSALYAAETEITGGVSPRISPFAAVRDLGGAMQRAGLALPVADRDRAEVLYRDPFALLRDLRSMGETGYLSERGRALRRDVVASTLARIGADARVTFDIVTLTGWAPHESQQKPLAPGSAKRSLKDALKEF